jgi:hypothetical protein
MNYFEQITFWEAFAVAPEGNSPALSPANIDKASEMLRKRSMETIFFNEDGAQSLPVESQMESMLSRKLRDLSLPIFLV